MKQLSKLKQILALLILLGCCSWGFLGHKTIHQISAYALPKKMATFFMKNEDYMVYNSVRPDVRRNTDKTEAPKHFIDLDAPIYGTDPLNTIPHDWDSAVKKYTADTLKKYGTLPWVVVAMQEKLTEAFRSKMKDSILFYAADLGHYVSDAHVPLHTSYNYDGQLTNQRGLHSLWETAVPEINIESYNLYTKHKAKYIKDPLAEIWAKIAATNKLLDGVFKEEINASVGFPDERKFKRSERFGQMRKNYTGEFAKAYGERLGNTINNQMLLSSESVADFWYTAWVNAGKPDLSDLETVTKEDKAKFKIAKKAWKNNELIKKGLLQSRKAKPEEF
ncbi:zinc dependent phospholipase C family protein [Arcicella aquatica]|uniref:Zinc dependent phospholipase C family protein n=1 Tax=Arcicella aquatica TaxID=217141 RepID=A0ABU5QJZ1_9BACT|nr:zinc dependent phospholipase C family protein [Arcicella aquatica]MEA5257385.1 zinc dependent phospholipase C family protein [Arcicella aquatica]